MLYVLYFGCSHVESYIEITILILVSRFVGWTESLVDYVLVEIL